MWKFLFPAFYQAEQHAPRCSCDPCWRTELSCSLIVVLIMALACWGCHSIHEARQMPEPSASGSAALQRELLERKREALQQRNRLKLQEANFLEGQARERRIKRYGTNPFMRFCLRHGQRKMVWREGKNKGCFVPPSVNHQDFTRDIDLALRRKTPVREVMGAWHREGAKSTFGTEWTAEYGLGEELVGNVVIVGAPSVQKEYNTRLRNIMRDIEEPGSTLRTEYPKLFPAKDAKKGWVKYTDSEVIFDNGGRLAAIPMGGNIRGQSIDGRRPDLVILDDPETRKLVRSKTLLPEARRWVEEDLIGSLGPDAIIIWNGTFLSYNCLLRWAMTPESEGGKGWSAPKGSPFIVPIDDGDGELVGNSNWPSYFPRERIAYLLKKHGPRAFAIERRLKVRPDEDAIYLEEWWERNQHGAYMAGSPGAWHPMGGLSGRPGNWELDGMPLRVVQAVDPAISQEDEADYFALATIGLHKETQRGFLLDMVRVKTPFPKQVALIYEQFDKWGPSAVFLETVAYQLALAQQVLSERAIPVVEVKRSRSEDAKEERLTAFSIHASNDKIITNLKQSAQREMVQESLEFPLGDHDDALDAVETAYEGALGHLGGVAEVFDRDEEADAHGWGDGHASRGWR